MRPLTERLKEQRQKLLKKDHTGFLLTVEENKITGQVTFYSQHQRFTFEKTKVQTGRIFKALATPIEEKKYILRKNKKEKEQSKDQSRKGIEIRNIPVIGKRKEKLLQEFPELFELEESRIATQQEQCYIIRYLLRERDVIFRTENIKGQILERRIISYTQFEELKKLLQPFDYIGLAEREPLQDQESVKYIISPTTILGRNIFYTLDKIEKGEI